MGHRGTKRGMEFVPYDYREAFRGVSKAHLADVVWNLAGRVAEGGIDHLEHVFQTACEESERVSLDRHDVSLGNIYERRLRDIERQEDRSQGDDDLVDYE